MHRMDISDEEVLQEFQSLNAKLLAETHTIEFQICKFKKLRYTHPFGRWETDVLSLARELHQHETIRLYILYGGAKPYKLFNNLPDSDLYHHSKLSDDIIDQYSRLLFLENMTCWDVARKCPMLFNHSRSDRTVKFWNISHWAESWKGIDINIWEAIVKNNKEQAAAEFLEWLSAK